jgi:hypothetical protein
MGTDCAFKKLSMLYCEFSGEALEIQAVGVRENPIGNITLYYCTALYFCPGP